MTLKLPSLGRRMRYALVVSGGFSFILLVVLSKPSLPTPTTTGGDPIVLPKQAHDFGIVQTNSDNPFTFTTPNPFSSDLQIDQVRRSCGCTSAWATQSIIGPGQALNVRVVLSVSNDEEGRTTHVFVSGHTARNRVEIEYTLQARAYDIIDFADNDATIRLGRFELATLPATQVLQIRRGKYPLDFTDLSADCESPEISATAERLDKDSWGLAIVVKTTAALGTISAPLHITFTKGGRRLPASVDKQVYAEIAGPFVASPSSLLINAPAGARVHRVIKILRRSQAGTPPVEFSITGASTISRNPAATAAISEGQNEIAFDYTVPSGPKAENSGAIVADIVTPARAYKLRIGFLALNNNQ